MLNYILYMPRVHSYIGEYLELIFSKCTNVLLDYAANFLG